MKIRNGYKSAALPFSLPQVSKKHFYTQVFYRLLQKTMLLLPVVLLFSLSAIAQDNNKDTMGKVSDSARPDIYALFRQAGKEQAAQSVTKYVEGRIALRQNELLSAIKQKTQKVKAYLKRGIDTAGIKRELTSIEKFLELAGEGIFTNGASIQTHRNLATSSKLINELLKKVKIQKTRIDNYEKDLVDFRVNIDSLATDSALYTFSQDTAALQSYFQKLVVASMEINEPDSSLKTALKHIQDIQMTADLIVNKIASELEELNGLEKELADNIFIQEFNKNNTDTTYRKLVADIADLSISKGKLTLFFYVENNLGKLFFLIVLIICLTLFLNGIKKVIQKDHLLQNQESGYLVLRNTLLSSVIIVINIFQFIFNEPPFIFSAILWTISFIALTITFRNYITRFWLRVWISAFFLFLLASADNLILEASKPEKTAILMIALAGLILGAVILLNRRKYELKEKTVLYFTGLLVVVELASIIANLCGLYNLSKNLMTTGYFNVIIGFLFLWTVRCINDGLSVASQVYASSGNNQYYINFEKVGKKVPSVFYFLLVTGWVILVGRNFYSFTLISRPLRNFLLDERTLGNYTFSINNIMVFFLIMAVSVIVSKVVSFFASDQHHTASAGSKDKKGGVGSWLLLIRIVIISLGLFLAVAAAGIPMDRITIVLGALGVGIGLGLQALVNNLVSGLIIAFEKPVNVGDVVEIGGQSGTMKSIGFRSSVISTWDGADMIIPNGDLLNAHLVNWTLSGSMRRVEILVGVAYKTDLEKTRQILFELIQSDERILKNPAPAVMLKEFNNSSIDLRVLFWVNKYGDWAILKSDLILAIDIAFKKNEIEIPFPQQDIYIREMPGRNKDNDQQNNTSL
jgi:potassium-dependent mechanosensitive channel